MSKKLLCPKTHEEVVALKKRSAKARGIEKMHIAYGPHPPDRCGDCVHIRMNRHSKNYYKCELYGMTSGPSTDWRLKYEACGKFVKRKED